jgi:hypothetical protein
MCVPLPVCYIWIYSKGIVSREYSAERLERGGPCWLLKLRRMGTQRVQIKRRMGTQKVQIKRGPSLVGCLGLSCRYKRFCSALAALVGPVQKNFFLAVHYFNSFVLIAQQAGQAAGLGRLSLIKCLWEQCICWTWLDCCTAHIIFSLCLPI